MRYIISWVVLLFGILISSSSSSYAALNIDITQGNVDPLPIALNDFIGVSKEERKLGHEIMITVASDLERSGLFRVIDRNAFIEKVTSGKILPHFASWRQINASGIVTGDLSITDDDKMHIEFRLWDAYAERQISGKLFTTGKANWRRVAHLISDKIYERLTGEKGYFDTRLVYIAETGPANDRVKRLAIMDQDSKKHTYLTDGNDLVLTPRFSPQAQKIIYMSYINNTPRVYVYNLDTGMQHVLGDFNGMSFAPRFSPKGDKAILSASLEGNSEIFTINLHNKQKKRLTFHSAIDTSPSFSPDERKIVFNSDRGGSQQIYVMESNGKNVKRISFGKGRYGTPVWSPRGDLIAFTKMYQGKFHIGVMRPDGTGERVLTESYLDEGPTWSPNGRVIIFTRQFRGNNAASYLYSIDLTGYNEIKVETPHYASDPAWSPLL